MFFMILCMGGISSAAEEVCVVSTGKWAPFNLLHNGKLEGIGIDYWEAVAKRIGVKTRYEIKPTWSEVLEVLKKRQCDLTVATQSTPSRESYAVFSHPYADFPIVIVTKMDVGFIDDLEQISDKDIVMPVDYATTEMVRAQYPDLHIRTVESIDVALQEVSEGKAFATIGVLPVVAYHITDTLSNLKISGKTALRFKVGFMVRADRKDLLKRINEAIIHLPPTVKKQIYAKWIKYPSSRFAMIPKWIWWVLGVLSAALLAVWFNVLKLKRNLHDKTNVEHALKEMAFVDNVTGAYSRSYIMHIFDEMWEEAEVEGKGFGIIFFDIDFMKTINDKYGHEKGDEVLHKVAKTVRKYLRKEDMLGRWGGDEFLIVLPDAKEDELAKLAKRLEMITSNIEVAKDFTVSCSFGYAAYCKGDTEQSLFKRADKRLYKVKQEHHKRILHNRKIKEQLEQASAKS
jgi:polar amino acid transport system substrate-binding protein